MPFKGLKPDLGSKYNLFLVWRPPNNLRGLKPLIRSKVMKHIWAPWRMEYIAAEKPQGCILCEKPKEDRDALNYILYRGKWNFVILNSYPYNPGHLMVAPYRHAGSLEELSEEELREHFDIVRKANKMLREAFCPHGFNIGINIGKAAGAGIEGHVHTHIVPRWEGDTNFMPVISNTRILPESLASTYEKLKQKVEILL
jgi:ATP adenylyltransferase